MGGAWGRQGWKVRGDRGVGGEQGKQGCGWVVGGRQEYGWDLGGGGAGGWGRRNGGRQGDRGVGGLSGETRVASGCGYLGDVHHSLPSLPQPL